jgi:hypothetical protein
MSRLIKLTRRCIILLTILQSSVVVGQPRFAIPIISASGPYTRTTSFGILPVASICISGDGFNGIYESFLPPIPPQSAFDARFVCPRSDPSSTCYDQGSLNDFRPFRNANQIDTFKLAAQVAGTQGLVLRWPSGLASHFVELTMRYYNNEGVVYVNMLQDTTADVTDAGDPARLLIFSRGLIVTSVDSDPPSAFQLYQNYPNPFNPTTTIRYSLQRPSHVTLVVYNTLGSQVAMLVNEMQSEGDHEVTFSGDGIAAGVYFYKISGEFVSMKKMVLLK